MLGEPVITTREASILLRTHISTLARWRSGGAGPAHIQMGGRVMYRESDIENWLATCTVNPEGVAA